MLRVKADIRTLAFCAFYFGLVAVQWAVPSISVLGGNYVVGVPLLIATAFFSFFCAVATHNTVHCPVFKKRWHNRVFQSVLTVTYGHPVSAFVPGHNLSHHKHTQTARDVMRTSKVRFRWNLLNGLLFMAMVGPAIMKGESEYFRTMKQRLPTWHRQLRLEFAALYGLYAALIALDIATSSGWIPWRFLVLVFIPHKYAAWGIITINLIQHDGCDPDHKYNHSRNFTGKVVNWFTFNNGFHGIHHDHPGLHWSLCPEAHAREIHPHIHPALEQKSLLVYLWKTFVWPGKRLTYDGKPHVLPAEIKDEKWVPRPEETQEDLGAIAPA